MNLDGDFIEKAKEIRASMNTKQTTIEVALITTSKYNAKKIIAICEICCDSTATDVHHINQQCDANHNNVIESNEYGIFNKNKLWNLVSLCKNCHKSVHNSPPSLNIIGYVNTSIGIELQYKWTVDTNTNLEALFTFTVKKNNKNIKYKTNKTNKTNKTRKKCI